MRKIFLLQGLLCLLGLSTVAQPSIPVDPVTGRAQISVPLGEVSYGNLSVPIVLVYNGSGVKPQASEGSGGMNWDLIAGGKISRDLRGLPDDFYSASDARRGWLTMNYAQQINDFAFVADDNLAVCTDEVGDWTFIRDLLYTKDPEPDIFSFNAPGLSGQFVFGPDKLPKLIPYQDVKIEFTPAALDAPITGITITKSDGTKYKFVITESITRDANPSVYGQPITQFTTEMEHYRVPLKFTSAWSLSSIESPSGAKISFCYGNFCNTAGEPDYYERLSNSKRNIELSSTASTATSAPFKQYYVQDIVETKDLYSISSPAKRVDLLSNGDGRITEVKFTGNGSTSTKSYRFQYVEAKNTTEQYGKRFLKQINESNSVCESFPAFQFEYYDITYGAQTATTSLVFNSPYLKQDYWGYFNDQAVSKNPTVYYYNTKTNAERYRFYPIPGLTATATINGANRAVNPAKIVYGSLKKITYPTGGTATVVYEPNDYHDAEANALQYGPGLRVKQVTIQDNVIAGSENIVYDYEYKLANNSSSGKWIYRSVFGYHDVGNFYATLDDQAKEPLILYERVKVKRSGRGETVYDYLLPGMYPLTTVSDWKATQTKFVRGSSPTCVSYGELKKQYFSHPFAYNTNYDFERGLLSKITEYNAGLQVIQEKEFSYQRLGTPTVVVKGLRFELLKNTSDLVTGANLNANTYVYGRYELLANLGKVVLTETVRTPDMSDNAKKLETITTYNYSTTHRMLSDIVALNSDGNTYKTKFTYAKDFSNLTQPNPSDVNSMTIKKLNDGFMHASPVETISSVIKSGVETVTGASLNTYAS